MTIVTLTQAQIDAGLRAGRALLSPNQFTFSIPTAAGVWPGYGANSEPFTQYSTLSAAQAGSFRQAVAAWDDVIAADFREVVETGNSIGEVRVAFTWIEGAGAYAYQGSGLRPGTAMGDVWISNTFVGRDFTAGAGSFFGNILLHEIGHTLGLKHSFETPVLPSEFENERFAVMSYTAAAQGTHVTFSAEGASRFFSQSGSVAVVTPMVVDIAAVQAIYGVDIATRAGDTVYRFDQDAAILKTIYDAGGIDTFDLSDFTRPSVVDLQPGAYSSVGIFSRAAQIAFWQSQLPSAAGSFIAATLNDTDDLYTFNDNVGIALSTVIENAVGGSGDDILLGNSAANSMAGGAGNDQIDGGAGNDRLDGGSGADRLIGGIGDDLFMVDTIADLIFELANEGADAVTAAGSFYLYANLEALTLSGATDTFGVGNELANTLAGNAGSNLLIGGAGNDTISGGAAVDSLFGETGADTLNGDAGVDYLVGGAGDDTLDGGIDADALYGEDGNDTLIGGASFSTDILVGGAGNDALDGASGLGDYDLMDGGAGDDVYRVDTPDDLTFEAVGGGVDTVVANIIGAGYYLYANTDNLLLEGQTPFGVGNELANTLTGNAIGNYLLGGAGNDTLNGKAGSDVLFGEGGADTFVFERGTGGDVIGDFLPGTDRIQLVGLGFSTFAQVQEALVENGGTSAINLGQGDFIVINGIANAQLTAASFDFG